MRTIARTIMLAASVFAASAICAPAAAQVMISRAVGGPMGGAEVISAKAADRFAGILGLDAAQVDAFKTLHRSYLSQIDESRSALREVSKKARDAAEDGDFDALIRAMEKASAEQQTRQAELTNTLLQDLRGMLTPEQETKWSRLERARRRESLPMLAWGPMSVSGAGVDLCVLVEGVKLPGEEFAKVAPVLEEYEVEIDAVIREGQAAAVKDTDEARKSDPGDGVSRVLDEGAMREMVGKSHARSKRAGEVNRRFVERLGATLAEPWRGELRKAWNKAAFRTVYRDPHILTQLKAAQGFEDLEAEQKVALAELLAEYERRLEELNAQWAEALLKQEMEGKATMFELGMDEESEVGKARRARMELDKAIRERMRAKLNEAQQARLPKVPSGPRVVTPGGGEMELDLGGMGLPDGAEIEVIAVPGR